MAALSTAAIAPLVIVGIFLERYIVSGLTTGAGKWAMSGRINVASVTMGIVWSSRSSVWMARIDQSDVVTMVHRRQHP